MIVGDGEKFIRMRDVIRSHHFVQLEYGWSTSSWFDRWCLKGSLDNIL